MLWGFSWLVAPKYSLYRNFYHFPEIFIEKNPPFRFFCLIVLFLGFAVRCLFLVEIESLGGIQFSLESIVRAEEKVQCGWCLPLHEAELGLLPDWHRLCFPEHCQEWPLNTERGIARDYCVLERLYIHTSVDFLFKSSNCCQARSALGWCVGRLQEDQSVTYVRGPYILCKQCVFVKLWYL